jgi:hypothetical protein
VHYYLYVLDLFARLDFTVESKTVVVGKDRFWVFGHHDDSDFILDELKVELCGLKVLIVGLVPVQLEQSGDEFELEEEVDAGVVAAVY